VVYDEDRTALPLRAISQRRIPNTYTALHPPSNESDLRALYPFYLSSCKRSFHFSR
jgi:hypothetical protein